MFDTARKLLLALLLILSQAGLTLHQIDFDQHADSGACVLCLAAHGCDHAIPAGSIPSLPQAAVESPVAALTHGSVLRAPLFRFARAPPSLTPLT